MSVSIRLSWNDVIRGAHVGISRHIEAMKMGLPDRHGCSKNDGWRLHIEGALGEIAAAKAIGVRCSLAINVFHRERDLLTYEVRTRSDHAYDLIIRRSDPSAIYILVTGVCPDYAVRGWIHSDSARRDEWLKAYGGREQAWFVPQSELFGIESIPRTTRQA